MNVKRLGDLIVDDLGNYYHVTEKNNQTITLVNAFMELSFRRRLDELYLEEHKGEYVGAHAMQLLKGIVERIEAKKNNLNIIPLRELKKEYKVKIIPLFDRT